MKRHYFLLIAALVVVAGVAGTVAAQDEDEGPQASLKFMVIKDSNGKPVKNAAVVLHPVKKGKQERGGMELKTNTEGKTGFEGIPYGLLRVQVLAPGFQTFGEDYNINKPEMEITIKLKRPAGQFSVYENPPAKKDEKDQKPQ